MIPCLCFNYFFVLLSIFRKRFWCSWKHLSGSAILFSWMIPHAKWESLSRVDGEKMHSNGNWKLLHTRSRWHAMTSEIRFVPLPSGDATSGHQTTLKELNLWSCIGLSSMEGLCDLVSLTKLYVIDCSDLLQLHDMDDFCSLRFLKIDQCRQLRSLPWSGLLVSLETFILFGCHQALEEQFQRKEGPDWDKKRGRDPGAQWHSSQSNRIVRIPGRRSGCGQSFRRAGRKAHTSPGEEGKPRGLSRSAVQQRRWATSHMKYRQRCGVLFLQTKFTGNFSLPMNEHCQIRRSSRVTSCGCPSPN